MLLTSAITLNIADPSTVSGHPELHHYTDLAGLKGIFESNTLRATHFSQLNDASEIIHLKELLVDAVTPRFIDILNSRQGSANSTNTDFESKLAAKLSIGSGSNSVAGAAAQDIVEGLYKFTFDNDAAFSFAAPFVASFCSHSSDQAYERNHGLLSQWRGYGKDGGFCIVFDTAALAELLGREFDLYYYVHMKLSSAVYAVDGLRISQAFPTLLDRCDTFFAGILDGQVPEAPDDGFQPFAEAATLLKHQGFREEREVRIVAMPGSERIRAVVAKEHSDFQPAPIKPVISPPNGRRFITLFEALNERLPIVRIIVGPSREQDRNFQLARDVTKDTVSILRSATPFIG